ncbi:hypothetical protein Tco_0972314 [Tanacetum coccineum]
MYEEEDDDVAKELYGDLNITQGLRDTDMTNAEQGTMQSSSISSDFTSKLLNLDNTGPYVNEIASLMNTATVPPSPPPVNPSLHLTTTPQQQTPDSTKTTTNLTITLPEIPNFASLFGFEQRVPALEKMSEFNQTSQFAKAVSSIPGIVDQYLASKMKEAVDVAVRLQSNKLKEEAKAENQEFFNQVDSTMKAIIKEQTSYAVAASLSEVELKKILIDKMETNKSINRSNIQKNLYSTLVEAYNSDKDIITSYGDVVTLKRGRDDQDKDKDPSAGSNRGTKRRKSSKDAEQSKGSNSKESKSSSSSKGTQSQLKSSGKSTQAKELEFEVADTEMQQDQGIESGHPPTPDHAWNESKSIDSQPPQKWINTIAKARQPPRTFNELMDTPIDFSAYIMNRLKIDNLTQEILVGPAFNLLKGSCKSLAELEYHFEECYKAVNDRLDWHNPEGRGFSFDLSKSLPLIKDRGRQVVPADYFINNDLEFLKGIEDMVPTLWSPVKVVYNKHAIWGTYHWGPKGQRFYAYFKEGDFPRLNLYDIEDMLLLLVQKKLSNLDVDDRYDLGVALRMFTRRIVILHRVQDLQLGVKSYQKKLNITRPEITRSDISKLTPYTAYKNPQGIINQDKYKRNSQNWRDLPRDIPLDSVVVLRYEKRSKSKNKGKVPTEMELVLEQTQQGTSYEVSVSAEKVFLMMAAARRGRRQSVKVKKLQDKCILKAFKLSYQEKYEHVGPKSQDHKMERLQDDVMRLCLVDDLKKLKITFKSRDDGEVMFIELIRKNDDSSEGEPEEEGSTITEGVGAEYFDIFQTRSELAYTSTSCVA